MGWSVTDSIGSGLTDFGNDISNGLTDFGNDIGNGITDTIDATGDAAVNVGSDTVKAYNFIKSYPLSGDNKINIEDIKGGTDFLENDIYGNNYTLFSKIMYGGVGFGAITFPTNIFKVLFTLIFPPLGEILNIIEDYLLDSFPYITWNTLKILFNIENLNRIIYSWVLTSMFYVPGLVYTLAKLTISSSKRKGITKCDPETGVCQDLSVVQPTTTKSA